MSAAEAEAIATRALHVREAAERNFQRRWGRWRRKDTFAPSRGGAGVGKVPWKPWRASKEQGGVGMIYDLPLGFRAMGYDI